MKYIPITCKRCMGTMNVQHGRRGYFYRCQRCAHTCKCKEPTRIEKDVNQILTCIPTKATQLCRTGS